MGLVESSEQEPLWAESEETWALLFLDKRYFQELHQGSLNREILQFFPFTLVGGSPFTSWKSAGTEDGSKPKRTGLPFPAKGAQLRGGGEVHGLLFHTEQGHLHPTIAKQYGEPRDWKTYLDVSSGMYRDRPDSKEGRISLQWLKIRLVFHVTRRRDV